MYFASKVTSTANNEALGPIGQRDGWLTSCIEQIKEKGGKKKKKAA